jgi:DNA modification methylase
MLPLYTSGDATLYCADNLQVLSLLSNDSVDLTVTSPPYDSLRDYTGDGEWNVAKFEHLARELYRATVSGGVVVWNIADQTINGSESGSSFRQALYFMDCGFLLADTMIYKKANPGGARGSNKTYTQCFEYMFILSKGPLKTHNLIADRPNKRPGSHVGGGKRQKNGQIGATKRMISEDCGRRFNIWEYPTQTDSFSERHPAPFPLALAEDHILSWSNHGDLVFDPFSGSGTTVIAAIMHGRQAIGVDISEEYTWLARERLARVQKDRASLGMFGL